MLKQLESSRRQMDELESKREELSHDLKRVTSLRALLYGTGEELEAAVRDALAILGFENDPAPRDDGESEFDAVFLSQEGRFLGEVEGKTKRAVNIDKISQLERNLQEDFSRDEVDEFVKGVLFGNAWRLVKLEDRDDFFTRKCVTAAQRAGIALVRTPDLFEIARHLRASPDKKFAETCRRAIHSASGVVELPALPRRMAQRKKHQ